MEKKRQEEHLGSGRINLVLFRSRQPRKRSPGATEKGEPGLCRRVGFGLKVSALPLHVPEKLGRFKVGNNMTMRRLDKRRASQLTDSCGGLFLGREGEYILT